MRVEEMEFVGWFVLIAYTVVIPAFVCTMHASHPELFHHYRWIRWIFGGGLFSWCFINASIFIPMRLGLIVHRGPEFAFAILFGWMYLWIASLPFMLCYAAALVIRKWMTRKK